MPRVAAVDVDLDAISSNVAALKDLAPHSELCAVVKADGYGHGAVEVARAALAGGATWLAVALVAEGLQLRAAGIEAPVLVLSEPPTEDMADAHAARLTVTVYTPAGIDAAAEAARAGAADVAGWAVHLKVDTGMHRVGADPADAVAMARRIVDAPTLHLGGTFTHLAVADEPDRPETAQQLERFTAVLDELAAEGIEPGLRHAANSAGLIAHPASHLDLVRAGIAVYGLSPSSELEGRVALSPAMSVRSTVTLVRHVDAGEGVSYGLRHGFDRPTTVAVVPMGYADGVPRALGSTGGEVLIRGRRHPIRGVVTMDQFVVEIDPGGPDVRPGDEVVLIGEQGGDRIGAEEWASRLDTISYEIVCGFSARMPRSHHAEIRSVRT